MLRHLNHEPEPAQCCSNVIKAGLLQIQAGNGQSAWDMAQGNDAVMKALEVASCAHPNGELGMGRSSGRTGVCAGQDSDHEGSPPETASLLGLTLAVAFGV